MHHLPSSRLRDQELGIFETKYKDLTTEILGRKPTKIDQQKDPKAKRLKKVVDFRRLTNGIPP